MYNGRKPLAARRTTTEQNYAAENQVSWPKVELNVENPKFSPDIRGGQGENIIKLIQFGTPKCVQTQHWSEKSNIKEKSKKKDFAFCNVGSQTVCKYQ